MGGLVRRGAGTGTLENRMECSKLFKASGRRPREEAGGFSWPGLWHPASGCSRFLSRFNAYTQACKRAARTFAFESCATYIPIDFLLFSSSFVFCSFPSIIVNTSFVPSRVSFFFFTFHSFVSQLSNLPRWFVSINRLASIVESSRFSDSWNTFWILIFRQGWSQWIQLLLLLLLSLLEKTYVCVRFEINHRTLAWPTRNKWNVIQRSRLKTAQESKRQREKR